MLQLEEKILIYNNIIDFNFKNFSRAYFVKISIDESDDETNIVSFKVAINYTKEFRNSYYLAEVTISDFLMNAELPQTMMQNFAIDCNRAIEKCIFQVNTSNEIVGLDNHNEILEKWYIVKQKLHEENEGELIDKYVLLFENMLVNKDLLLQKMQKNLFINQYFFPIFGEVYHGFKKINIEKFNFFDVDYEQEMLVEIENNGNFDKNDNFIVHKKIIKNTNNTSENIITDYHTQYVLHKDKSIQKIFGEFLNNNKKYSFEIDGAIV